MTPGRVWSIILVAILHALLGYAFVTGLAYKFVKQAAEDLKVVEVQEEAPPPEEPPPEQPREVPPPPVTAPPPLVQLPQAPSPVVVQPPLPPAPPPPIQVPPPPAPPPPPVRVEPARARGDLRSVFSDSDYPASAIRGEESGTVRASLTVGPDGRVTNCTVTASSGSAALDAATCNILRRRGRFTPARDSSGNPTSDTVAAPPIRWVLPTN
jgi:protein TonB